MVYVSALRLDGLHGIIYLEWTELMHTHGQYKHKTLSVMYTTSLQCRDNISTEIG